MKERSPAQIAAAQRLAEYNKALRKQKKQEESKSAVKEVITELAVAQEMRKKQEPKPIPQPTEKEEPQPFSLFAY